MAKGAVSGKLKVPLALALTASSLLAAHFLFKVNYPTDRTGLYLAPLAGITWPPRPISSEIAPFAR
jgi:hypothetical protein